MAGLISINIFAIVVTAIGFHVAFRQRLVRGLVRQQAKEVRPPRRDEDEGVDPLASVLRIAGVMLMAFGITVCAFANLIVYFSNSGV